MKKLYATPLKQMPNSAIRNLFISRWL